MDLNNYKEIPDITQFIIQWMEHWREMSKVACGLVFVTLSYF